VVTIRPRYTSTKPPAENERTGMIRVGIVMILGK
jgi:hypothetical protein